MTASPTTDTLLHRYQHLMEISRDLVSTFDLDALLAHIVSVAVEISGSEAASILLLDETNQQLYFQTASNMAEIPIMRGMVVPSEGSLAGWVVQNRQPVIVNDVRSDQRHDESVDEKTRFSTSSLMGIPLIAKDKIIGVLEVLNKIEGPFTSEDQEVMTVLGAQAAIAIQNTRLFQQSDLIAELVHELRTPLSSLSAVAHLLMKRDIEETQRDRLVVIMNGEVQRLNNMATSFLDLARLESGRAIFHQTTFDLKILLEECAYICQSKADENKLTMQVEVTPDLPALEADRDKIKQVLLNLISNAIKYNRTGGSIKLQAVSRLREMRISVEDTGPGILPDELPHLFEKFFRASRTERGTPGTGLGLSICRRIMDAHRGQIEVESQVGKGTRFTLVFPLRQEQSPKPA